MDQFKDLLADLHQNEIFQQWLKQVRDQRPQPPQWNGGKGKDNTEQWKHESAMQQGWDLCYQQLTQTQYKP